MLALFLLGGCADVAAEIKGVTYDDAIEATSRNHDTRFDWRAECRDLVSEEVAMYRRQAVLAESEGKLEEASAFRKRAAEALNANFPALVTVQLLRQATAEELEKISFDDLGCFEGYDVLEE